MVSTRAARRVLPGLVFALIVAAAMPAPHEEVRAQEAETEAPTYELLAGCTWQAGDVVTTTKHDVQRRRSTASVGGNVVQDDASDEVVDSTIVQRMLVVGDAGEVESRLVYVAAWERTIDGSVFMDLQGAVLEVTGDGPTRAWTALTDDARWHPDTRAWVDSEYGPRKRASQAFGSAMRPDRPVAIGDEWTPDVSNLLDALGLSDASDVTANARLDRVGECDGMRAAWIDCAISMPIPMPASLAIEWMQGGTMELQATGTVPLEPRALGEEGVAEMSVNAVGTISQGGTEVELKLEMAFEMTTSRRAGGEIPELPPRDGEQDAESGDDAPK